MSKITKALELEQTAALINVTSQFQSIVLYNVLFSPSGPMPNQLPDRKSVGVKFFIGPPAPGNAVPPDQQAVNPDILSAQRDTTLLVTMSCAFCDSPGIQKQSIVFSPAKRASTVASFSIIPDKTKTRNQSGTDQVVFQVTSGGILYDDIVVPIAVDTNFQAQQQERPESIPGNMVRPAGSRSVDLTITCFVDPSGRIDVELEPTNPALVALFGGAENNSDGTPKIFTTGTDANGLSQIVADDYAQLASVVEQNSVLQTALTGDPSRLLILGSSNNVLDDHDRDSLLNAFYSTGRDLYRRLFLQDVTLANLANRLDSWQSGDRPPRIRVETQGVKIPWQFLHPLSRLDSGKFWGFRYELIVDPQGDQGPGYYPGVMRYSSGPMIFAKYHSEQTDSDADKDVSKLGTLQVAFLTSNLGLKGVKPTDSPDEFENAIESLRDTVQMIVAYTHAENGTIFQAAVDGRTSVARDIAGPKLLFSKNQFVTALQLDSLPSKFLLPTITLKEHPLVILNGCETAGGGYYSDGNLNFPAVFLHFGARGVIATEAPVWEMFGYYFGESLLSNLQGNEPASLALLNTRRAFMQSSNNPLGLLYSYYGGVDATVTFSGSMP